MENAELQIICYRTNSCDGYDDNLWCVNEKVHVHYCRGDMFDMFDEGERISIKGPCDRSCRDERIDLRSFVTKLQRELAHPRDGHQVFFDFDSISSYSRLSDKPIVGRLFVDGYCKRNSRWDEICDGKWHITVHEDLQSLCGESSTRHYMETTQCDDSCKSPVVASEKLAQILCRYMRMKYKLSLTT